MNIPGQECNAINITRTAWEPAKSNDRETLGRIGTSARSQAVLGNASLQVLLAESLLEAGASTPGSQAQHGNQQLESMAWALHPLIKELG